MFWFFIILLCFLAALFVLVPLWQGSKQMLDSDAELRKEANVALFQERAKDLATDLETGDIDQLQYDQLLAELQQNLLLDVDTETPKVSKAASRKSKTQAKIGRATLIVPIFAVLTVPVAAILLYEQWGYLEEIQLTDLFERTVNNRDDVEEAKDLIVQLGEAAQADDSQPWTLYFLAENFANLGMFNEASIAYSRAAELLEETPDKALVLGRVALAQYILAEFRITPEVLAVIEQARAINPSEISILQLLAADAESREDYEAAIEYWRLLIQASPNSEQSQSLRANIAAAQQILARDNPELADGPSIDVALSLAEGVEVPGNLRVFVAARNADREGMPPLAAVDLLASELPIVVRLDNFSAVGPFNLSSADSVYISALVSNTGTASPQSGDFRVVSENFSPNGQNVSLELVLAEQIP